MEPGTWSQGCLGAARLRATNRACRSADRLTSVLGQLSGAAECGIRRPLPTHLPTCRIPALPAASLLELSEPPPTSRPDLSLCWTIPPSTASPWPAPPVQEASLVLSHLSCGHFHFSRDPLVPDSKFPGQEELSSPDRALLSPSSEVPQLLQASGASLGFWVQSPTGSIGSGLGFPGSQGAGPLPSYSTWPGCPRPVWCGPLQGGPYTPRLLVQGSQKSPGALSVPLLPRYTPLFCVPLPSSVSSALLQG